VVDYGYRVSDKSFYIAPTRGRLGNALKTVVAATCVAGDGTGRVIIDSLGTRSIIDVRVDQIAQVPKISVNEEPGFVKSGTSIAMDLACLIGDSKADDFYESLEALLTQYAVFNPHAAFHLSGTGEDVRFEAPAPKWQKWTPSQPTSPHWYSDEQFADLIAAHLAADRCTERVSTIREFIQEFSGLRATQVQKEITGRLGLSFTRLDAFVQDGEVDQKQASQLLSLMCEFSKEVDPKRLGVIGKKLMLGALEAWGVDPSSTRYAGIKGVYDGSPGVVEVVFGCMDADCWHPDADREVVFGLNFSPALEIPDQRFRWEMGHNLIDYDDPVIVIVHVTYPSLSFTDAGKGTVAFPSALSDALGDAVTRVARDWKRHKERVRRQARSEEREWERQQSSKNRRGMSIKDAASYEVMETAYLKASGGGQYPATARQVMYAARPIILGRTGRSELNDVYFTQTLLPDFLNKHPCLKQEWSIEYDARGRFREPHRDREIGIGTREVRSYVSSWPSHKPEHHYGAILFIEKEGFDPLFDRAQIAQRFDLGIMSTKGMSVVAARTFIEALAARNKGVKVFVLHDFDAYGFGICHTLWNDNRRHVFETRPEVIDLGLRLDDVLDLSLESEPHVYKEKKDPRERLREYGATDEECEFLVQRSWRGGWEGNRVELNAMMSDQFVSWLESKLESHGVSKVVPDNGTLARGYRDSVREKYIDEKVAEARKTQPRDSEIVLPEDLMAKVNRTLEMHRTWSWEQAVTHIVRGT